MEGGGKRRREQMEGGERGGETRRGGHTLSVCGERNVWNPNCVIAPEQTLVLPVIPQTAGSERVCVCERDRRGGIIQ